MDDPSLTNLRDVALALGSAGISVVPIDSTTKRPAMSLLPRDEAGKPVWGPFQKQIPDEATVNTWFDASIEAFAVVGGAVSGGLLVLDFDVERFYHAWVAEVGELADGLPVQRTGGGGYQVFLRTADPGSNAHLAWVECPTAESGREIALETRGEGGYAVVAPSLHPSGNRYQMISGDLTAIPVISQARADALLAATRKLDEAPHTRQERERMERDAAAAHQRRAAASRNGSTSVIDKFNESNAIDHVLARYGYTACGDRFIRPEGKSPSVSVRGGRSCHFSSNDPLNDGGVRSGMGVHDAFDVFTHFEHGGNVRAAVKSAAGLLGIRHTPPPTDEADGPDDLDGPHGVSLRVADIARTPTRINARFDVLIDGVSTEMDLPATDTASGVRKAGLALCDLVEIAGRTLEAEAQTELKFWLTKQLARRSLDRLHSQLQRAQAASRAAAPPDTRPTMLQIAIAYMRKELDLRFVEGEPLSVWSEELGVSIRQNDFVQRIEPGLLAAIAGARDYPAPTANDPTKHNKHLQQVLKPVWCAVTKDLPRETHADTGPNSRAADRFKQAILRAWNTTDTWIKVESTATAAGHVERMSMASRVRHMVNSAGERPDRWKRVLSGVSAFYRVYGSPGAVWLGMRADMLLHEIKGCAVPGVRNQHDLATLLNRYGLADTSGVPVYITDGDDRQRIVVLSRALCDLLVECADEPEKPPLRKADEARATEVVDGDHVDVATGEVLDAM